MEPGNEGETRGRGPGEYGRRGRDSRAFTEVLGWSQKLVPAPLDGGLAGPWGLPPQGRNRSGAGVQ